MAEAPVAQRMTVGDIQEERREIEVREGGKNSEDEGIPKVVAPSVRGDLGNGRAGDEMGQGCWHREIVQGDCVRKVATPSSVADWP